MATAKNIETERNMQSEKNAETAQLDLREEFEVLRKQVNELLAELKTLGQATSAHLADKVQSGASYYQEKAGEKLHDAYEASNESLNEVNDQVRRNPVVSLMIAFGVGYIISRMLGQDK